MACSGHLQESYIGGCTISPALGFIKLSVLLFYLQLFWPVRWLRIGVYVGAGISSSFYFAATVITFYYYTPHRHETWVERSFSAGFSKLQDVSILTGVMGLVIDTFALVLPIRVISGLQMPTRRKLGVLLLFATGMV